MMGDFVKMMGWGLISSFFDMAYTSEVGDT